MPRVIRYTISYCSHTIICGNKCTHTGLWMVPLTKIAKNQAASPTSTAKPTSAFATNVNATSSAIKYARHIHQCLCSPPSATLLVALRRSDKLTTIPGLTPTLIKYHLPCSTANDKG